MTRPTLIVQTVYLHPRELEAARALGNRLYEHLSRPADDPLAFGAGLPVYSAVAPEKVDPDAAVTVVVIPVLGTASQKLASAPALAKMGQWKAAGCKVLPVLTDLDWRNYEMKLPAPPIRAEKGGSTPDSWDRPTLDEITLALSRIFLGGTRVTVFISHAKADLAATNKAAEAIRDHILTSTTGQAFFDSNAIAAGTDESIEEQIERGLGVGADGTAARFFLALRGDAYSSRVWCQRELLCAKRVGLPTLTVEILTHGESRSAAYGGNGPCVVWTKEPAAVVSRAMVEWVRAEHFRREGARIADEAGLPNVVVLCRPPELLDLAQGPLLSRRAQIAMHPDPELAPVERAVLTRANPRLHLVTPTSVYRRVLHRAPDVDAPLQGLQVAISISNEPEIHGAEGYTSCHVQDAVVHLARCLISSGASIAYGGVLKASAATPGGSPKVSFTELLADLVRTYNQTTERPAELLYNYLAATEDIPKASLQVRHMTESPEVSSLAVLPPPGANPVKGPYFSDMRRAMARMTDARLIMRGKSQPNSPNRSGFRGRFPGVVEEAWLTLESGKPLYVLGGFGGASQLVADLLGGAPTPQDLKDGTWANEPDYQVQVRELEADDRRKKLGLPSSLDTMADAIRTWGSKLLESDAASTGWNGLTAAENKVLFGTRDPVTIASLVIRGLLCVRKKAIEGKLQIELVQDTIASAKELDALAVATFDGVPLGGAGAALDRIVAGRASLGRAQGQVLINLGESDIDADWLYLASLGAPGSANDLEKSIVSAAKATAAEAVRHGFRRVGIVAFGGAVLDDTPRVVSAMLRGFKDGGAQCAFHWFESDPKRFEEIARSLKKAEAGHEVIFTERVNAAAVRQAPLQDDIVRVEVRLENETLRTTVLLPSGRGAVQAYATNVDAATMKGFSTGSGFEKRSTPDLAELATRGPQIAEKLFGKAHVEILSRCHESKLVIVHDVESSRLPFELMTTGQTTPAVGAGVSRRLAVEGLAADRLFKRPPKSGKLDALLVIDPTEDLPGAAKEGLAVRRILEKQADHVNLSVLEKGEATIENVVARLANCDVFHYCGHAFFDGPGEEESGLVLSGHSNLTLKQLRSAECNVRVAFVNACEAGRVRGAVATEAAAFAELFLRSGVESYLGTYWRVSDDAAYQFAEAVYGKLAEGQTLEAAVLEGRKLLFSGPGRHQDWANYILYGSGDFRLVR